MPPPKNMELEGELGIGEESSLVETMTKDISRAKAKKSLAVHPDDGGQRVLNVL